MTDARRTDVRKASKTAGQIVVKVEPLPRDD
jgi:hypothetical protein